MAPTPRTPSRSPMVPDVTSIWVSAVLSSARRPVDGVADLRFSCAVCRLALLANIAKFCPERQTVAVWAF
jgi:hypothetical protein